MVLGLTIGLGYGLSAGDVGYELPRLLARTMVTLPAVWVMTGVAASLTVAGMVGTAALVAVLFFMCYNNTETTNFMGVY